MGISSADRWLDQHLFTRNEDPYIWKLLVIFKKKPQNCLYCITNCDILYPRWQNVKLSFKIIHKPFIINMVIYIKLGFVCNSFSKLLLQSITTSDPAEINWIKCWRPLARVKSTSNDVIPFQLVIKISTSAGISLVDCCQEILDSEALIKIKILSPKCQDILIRPYSITVLYTALILGLHPANERCRYKVMAVLIGWVQT